MELRPGSRAESVVDTTEVVVIRAPQQDLDLRCGGHAMLPLGSRESDLIAGDPGFVGPTLLGKRYVDATGEIELLCTKSGDAALSLGDELLSPKEAKPLPSSD